MASVNTFYNSVINEVIENLKTHFKDDGFDLAVFQDLKDIWERKIRESGALEPQRHHNPAPSSMQFTNIIQQHQQQGTSNAVVGGAARIQTINNGHNNGSARLIKPSSQTLISEQASGPQPATAFNPHRISVPVILQGGGANFRPGVVPMVINAAQAPGGAGMAVFSQYQHLLPQHQQQQNQAFIQDNSTIRKNQLDGMNDDSSEDDDDLIPVSEADPQSVAPDLSMPGSVVKQEETGAGRAGNDDDDEEDEEAMINLTPGSEVNIRPAGVRAVNDDDDDDDDDEDEEESDKEEEDPLNSEDDVSEDDPDKVFECENVIVCQFDKVNRTRSKWKLNFVSGIANLDGRDTVFHKATGEAEW